MRIKIILFHTISIPLRLFSSHFQKLTNFLIPPKHLDFVLFSENKKFTDLKHMILSLQTISNDMSPQRYHFDSFELIPNFPTHIVHSKLKTTRTIQKKQDSQ